MPTSTRLLRRTYSLNPLAASGTSFVNAGATEFARTGICGMSSAATDARAATTTVVAHRSSRRNQRSDRPGRTGKWSQKMSAMQARRGAGKILQCFESGCSDVEVSHSRWSEAEPAEPPSRGRPPASPRRTGQLRFWSRYVASYALRKGIQAIRPSSGLATSLVSSAGPPTPPRTDR